MTVSVISGSTQSSRQDDVKDFKVDWFSGYGKGGQNRNKTQNCCRVTHLPTGISRKAETRSREASYREAMGSLSEALRVLATSAASRRVAEVKKGQVGSGMRGDKRRTYRLQDDSVVDHQTGRSARASQVMRGHFELLR